MLGLAILATRPAAHVRMISTRIAAPLLVRYRVLPNASTVARLRGQCATFRSWSPMVSSDLSFLKRMLAPPTSRILPTLRKPELMICHYIAQFLQGKERQEYEHMAEMVQNELRTELRRVKVVMVSPIHPHTLRNRY